MYNQGCFRIHCNSLVIFQTWPLNLTQSGTLVSVTFYICKYISKFGWTHSHQCSSWLFLPFLDISCYIDFILGIRELSLISNGDLFLCKSGDEIRSLGDRCNIRPNCGDRSDERDCDQCKLFWSEVCTLEERKNENRLHFKEVGTRE